CEQPFAIRSKNDGPVLKGRSGGDEGVSDVGGVEVRVLLQVGCEALCRLGQGGLCFGRKGEGDRAWERLLGGSARALPCLPVASHPGGLGRLLQDHVGVGAADAEGGDAGPTGATLGLPRQLLGQELDLPCLPVDLGGGSVDV